MDDGLDPRAWLMLKGSAPSVRPTKSPNTVRPKKLG
jgi:hypothetical protein